MKKSCLVPKHICPYHHDKCTCRPNKPSNKRSSTTTKCSWAARNDSSNVAAALHPNSLKSSLDSESDEAFNFCSAGVRRKLCLGDNNCYCNKKLLEPTLMQRPRTCIVLDEPVPKPKIKVESEPLCFKIVPCHGKELRARPQAPSERLKKLKADRHQEEEPCLRYSRDRENYEHMRDILDEDCLCQIRKLEDEIMNQGRRKSSDVPSNKLEDHFDDQIWKDALDKVVEDEKINAKSLEYSERGAQEIVETGKPSESLQNTRRPSKNGGRSPLKNGKYFINIEEGQYRRDSYDSSEARPLYVASNFTENTLQREEPSQGVDESIKERSPTESPQASTEGTRHSLEDERLIQFRKDHYAETHTMPGLRDSIPEHVCVHKFQLDQRLFPMPLNSDVYGTSRCIICDKLMPVEKTVFKDERLEKKTFPKYYKYGMKPRRVNIGAENTKIVLKLTEKDVHLLKDLPFAFRKPEHRNTHALRFQKGAF